MAHKWISWYFTEGKKNKRLFQKLVTGWERSYHSQSWMSIKVKLLQAQILGKLVSGHWGLSQTITPSVPLGILIQNGCQVILGVDVSFCSSNKESVKILDMMGPQAIASKSSHSPGSICMPASGYIGTVGILGKLHSHRVTETGMSNMVLIPTPSFSQTVGQWENANS